MFKLSGSSNRGVGWGRGQSQAFSIAKTEVKLDCFGRLQQMTFRPSSFLDFEAVGVNKQANDILLQYLPTYLAFSKKGPFINYLRKSQDLQKHQTT